MERWRHRFVTAVSPSRHRRIDAVFPLVRRLRRLLTRATSHSARPPGRPVGLLVLNGLRVLEAFAADVRDYGRGVSRIVRKGGKPPECR
jgi:hypothetical protein